MILPIRAWRASKHRRRGTRKTSAIRRPTMRGSAIVIERAIVAWTIAVAVTLASGAEALPVAYVAQPYAGLLTGLDALRGESIGSVALALPFQSYLVRVSPDGSRAYLASGLDVSVVDMETSGIVFTFEPPRCTWGICSIRGLVLSEDGKVLYVATDDRLTYHGHISVFDASSGALLESFDLEARPQTMVGGSTGLLYIPDMSSDTLVVFDPMEKRAAAEITLRSLTPDVALSPDAKRIFVSTYGGNGGRRVEVFDGVSFAPVTSLPVPGDFAGIAVAPDGKTVYMVVPGTGLIVLDTAGFSILATIPEDKPGGLIVWPDGTSVYLLKRWSSEVIDIDTRDYSIRRTFEVPMIEETRVFSPDGGRAYFPAFYDPRGLRVFDRATDSVRTILEGSGPNQVAVRNDGRFVYGIGDQLVWVIDPVTDVPIASFSLSDPPEEDLLPPPDRRKYLAGNPITMLDLERNRVARRFSSLPDAIQVGAVVPSADGQRLYAGTAGLLAADEDICSLAHVVTLDTATGDIIDRMALPKTGIPVAVALDAQEENIYVAIRAPDRPDICGRFEPDFPGCDCPDFDGVVVLSLATRQGVAAIPVRDPSDVLIHPNGQTVYIAGYGLLLVDAQRKEIAKEFPYIEATRLALSADGKLLLAQAASSVTAVATEDNRVVWRSTLASPADDIAIGPELISTLPPPCLGDCNGDGKVGIDELITGVNVAIAAGSLSETCLALDMNGDGTAAINELVAAVNTALSGCNTAMHSAEVVSGAAFTKYAVRPSGLSAIAHRRSLANCNRSRAGCRIENRRPRADHPSCTRRMRSGHAASRPTTVRTSRRQSRRRTVALEASRAVFRRDASSENHRGPFRPPADIRRPR